MAPYSLDEIVKMINAKLTVNELIKSDYNGSKRIHYKDESKFIFDELFLYE